MIVVKTARLSLIHFYAFGSSSLDLFFPGEFRFFDFQVRHGIELHLVFFIVVGDSAFVHHFFAAFDWQHTVFVCGKLQGFFLDKFAIIGFEFVNAFLGKDIIVLEKKTPVGSVFKIDLELVVGSDSAFTRRILEYADYFDVLAVFNGDLS
jgi:hypothetical protein